MWAPVPRRWTHARSGSRKKEMPVNANGERGRGDGRNWETGGRRDEKAKGQNAVDRPRNLLRGAWVIAEPAPPGGLFLTREKGPHLGSAMWAPAAVLPCAVSASPAGGVGWASKQKKKNQLYSFCFFSLIGLVPGSRRIYASSNWVSGCQKAGPIRRHEPSQCQRRLGWAPHGRAGPPCMTRGGPISRGPSAS